MRENKDTVIHGRKATLVPYKKEHVLKYHEWMQNEELQQLTASEPLTLDQEYEMQQSWFDDQDNVMVGDVNLFLNDPDDRSAAEVEVMIAEVKSRGKGIGQEATLAIMKYGIDCLNIKQYSVKIGLSNKQSIALFTKLGFNEVSRSDVFEEVTMALPLTAEALNRVHMLAAEIVITQTNTSS